MTMPTWLTGPSSALPAAGADPIHLLVGTGDFDACALHLVQGKPDVPEVDVPEADVDVPDRFPGEKMAV